MRVRRKMHHQIIQISTNMFIQIAKLKTDSNTNSNTTVNCHNLKPLDILNNHDSWDTDVIE